MNKKEFRKLRKPMTVMRKTNKKTENFTSMTIKIEKNTLMTKKN